MAWFVSFLMLLTAAITWPIGKLLDWVLGAESPLFKRRELKALMSIHADPMVGSQGRFRLPCLWCTLFLPSCCPGLGCPKALRWVAAMSGRLCCATHCATALSWNIL
jgi:hypothetical protein